jgi:Fis family transcriptional regulator
MKSIRQSIQQSLTIYFETLDGADPKNVYDLVISQVEKSLLEIVLIQTKGNQSKAAQWLNLSRNTLRKLLIKHKLIQNKKDI